MIKHLAYDLDGSVPLDVTLQTIESGHHANLGKKMDLTPWESLVFWFWKDMCLGVADLQLVSTRPKETLQVWTGPMRTLRPDERLAVAAHGSKSRRGGAYLLPVNVK